MRSRLFGIFAALLLLSLPTFAADRVIQNGSDLWYTAGDGSTFINFAKIPIPAGFFCFKSAPFTGRVVFRGVPVATAEPGVLGATDTIVQRLDDAAFNKRGVAVTRVQVRALHFESVKPIKTACGEYRVEVRLSGEQPITRMRIVRENANGGRFFAPIAVNGKVVFTPVGKASSEILEVTRNVRFPANQGIRWADQFGNKGLQRTGFVLVDTDNDRRPDTYLPGTSSNFAAGWSSQGGQAGRQGGQTKAQLPPGCHLEEDTEGHCPGGVLIYY
jgi:hypothetical protein